MFTGLVREIGMVARVAPGAGKTELELSAPLLAPTLELGDSVAINGACQTVVRTGKRSFVVEALAETMSKTTLGSLRVGARVNLEPALTPATPLGGHMVQGHVNETARVAAVQRDQENIYLSIAVSEKAARYCVAEGSICIDGVSLTVARLEGCVVTMNIIPHTWEATTLAELKPGAAVNIETDIIARYVERFLEARMPAAAESGSALEHNLQEWGYRS